MKFTIGDYILIILFIVIVVWSVIMGFMWYQLIHDMYLFFISSIPDPSVFP